MWPVDPALLHARGLLGAESRSLPAQLNGAPVTFSPRVSPDGKSAAFVSPVNDRIFLNFQSRPADTSCVNRSLCRAREKGYLNAAPRAPLTEYSRWCWHLKIPVIWMERCSPHSRYGRVYLDLFTTPLALTEAGRRTLESFTTPFGITGKVAVSAHDARWDRVPFSKLELLAHAVLRAVHDPGNYRIDQPQTPAAALSFTRQQIAC